MGWGKIHSIINIIKRHQIITCCCFGWCTNDRFIIITLRAYFRFGIVAFGVGLLNLLIDGWLHFNVMFYFLMDGYKNSFYSSITSSFLHSNYYPTHLDTPRNWKHPTVFSVDLHILSPFTFNFNLDFFLIVHSQKDSKNEKL